MLPPDPETPGTLEEADLALTTVSADEAPPAAAEPAAPAEGQPRDEKGRFTGPAPEAEPEAPSSAPAPAPETPGEPAPPETAQAVEESYPEFTYRADGQEHAIPGSAVGEDGIFIPQQQVPELHQLLAAGRAAFGSVRQRLNDAAQREKAALDRAAAAEAQAQTILGHFETLIERGQIADWLQGVQLNWPVLKAEARAKAVELARQADADRLKQYEERDRVAQMRPLMEQTLEQSVAHFAQQAGLDQPTAQAVYQRLRDPRYESQLFVKAPYDDPVSGIRQGELVIDHSVVEGAVQLASMGRTPMSQQQKIAQAQAANAKQAVAAKVPPTVGKSAGAPAPKGIPQFKSQAEVDRWFEQGGYNDLELEER
jgi:hypothetical protein